MAPNSAAEKCNIRCGDQILSANYISFLNISCKRAYEILANSENQFVQLALLPRSKTFPQRQRRHNCFAWIDPNGQTVSPPPPDREFDPLDENDLEDTRRSGVNFIQRIRRAPRLRDLNRPGSSAHQLVSKLNSLPFFKRKPLLSTKYRLVRISINFRVLKSVL